MNPISAEEYFIGKSSEKGGIDLIAGDSTPTFGEGYRFVLTDIRKRTQGIINKEWW